MSQSSSGNSRGSSDRNRSGNRSGGGNRNRHRSDRSRSNRNSGGNRGGGGNRRRRRPEPKPTVWQKFVKAITFGLVDPVKSGKKKRSTKPAQKRERRAPQVVEPTSPRLYVGNLNYEVDSDALKAHFSGLGTVVEASVVTHSGSGRSKGFAFVEMGSIDEAKAAVAKLNDSDLKGRKMLVTGAKSEKRKDGERGDGKRNRSEGRSERRDGRREGGRERREGGRDRRGRGRTGDKPEKASRQVKPLKIEQVSTPSLSITGLNSEATDVDITDLFAGVGTVESREDIEFKEGANTREIRVEMASVEDAQKAVELLHGKSFMGIQLKVNGSGGSSSKKPAADVKEEPKTEAEAPSEEVTNESSEPLAETEWSPSADEPRNEG